MSTVSTAATTTTAAELDRDRRTITVDLPAHGGTPGTGTDVTLDGLATYVAGCRDALGLARVDLVANDTGGAVAQIVAAREPHRLHTLTFTNCDTHDNLPPPKFLPTVLLARARLLAPAGRRALRRPEQAKRRLFGSGYADLDRLPDDVYRGWLRAVFGTPEAARMFQSCVAGLDAAPLRAVLPRPRALDVPTLVFWGDDDEFFPVRCGRGLHDTIPGARAFVEVPGGRLFLPDERADELVADLRRHWS